MSKDTANKNNSQPRHRDESHWLITEETQPEEFDFKLSPPIYTGRFKKGFDPRRHTFTREECSRGFWAAIESIITRHPNAIAPDGRHIACFFLHSRTQGVQAF